MKQKEIFKKVLLYLFVFLFLIAAGCSGGGGGDDDHFSDDTNISNDDTNNDDTDNDDVAKGELPIGKWVNDSDGISFTIAAETTPCETCDTNYEWYAGSIEYDDHTIEIPNDNELDLIFLMGDIYDGLLSITGHDGDWLSPGSWGVEIFCDEYSYSNGNDYLTCTVLSTDGDLNGRLEFIRQ